MRALISFSGEVGAIIIRPNLMFSSLFFLSMQSFQHLQKTLEYVARLSKKEFPDDPTQMSGNLGKQVEDLTNRLFKVRTPSSNCMT